MEDETSLTLLEWISPCFVFRRCQLLLFDSFLGLINRFWNNEKMPHLVLLINLDFHASCQSYTTNRKKAKFYFFNSAKILHRQGSAANFRNSAQFRESFLSSRKAVQQPTQFHLRFHRGLLWSHTFTDLSAAGGGDNPFFNSQVQDRTHNLLICRLSEWVCVWLMCHRVTDFD